MLLKVLLNSVWTIIILAVFRVTASDFGFVPTIFSRLSLGFCMSNYFPELLDQSIVSSTVESISAEKISKICQVWKAYTKHPRKFSFDYNSFLEVDKWFHHFVSREGIDPLLSGPLNGLPLNGSFQLFVNGLPLKTVTGMFYSRHGKLPLLHSHNNFYSQLREIDDNDLPQTFAYYSPYFSDKFGIPIQYKVQENTKSENYRLDMIIAHVDRQYSVFKIMNNDKGDIKFQSFFISSYQNKAAKIKTKIFSQTELFEALWSTQRDCLCIYRRQNSADLSPENTFNKARTLESYSPFALRPYLTKILDQPRSLMISTLLFCTIISITAINSDIIQSLSDSIAWLSQADFSGNGPLIIAVIGILKVYR